MTDGSSAPTVAELMSTPVVTGSPDETLAEAAGRMREKRVGSVVVVQDDKPVGILTERDMIRIAAAGADTSRAHVSEWMTPNPDSVAPGVPANPASGFAAAVSRISVGLPLTVRIAPVYVPAGTEAFPRISPSWSN